MELLIMHFSAAPPPPVILWSKYSPREPVYQHPKSAFSFFDPAKPKIV
jgi:hypothetical protein